MPAPVCCVLEGNGVFATATVRGTCFTGDHGYCGRGSGRFEPQQRARGVLQRYCPDTKTKYPVKSSESVPMSHMLHYKTYSNH